MINNFCSHKTLKRFALLITVSLAFLTSGCEDNLDSSDVANIEDDIVTDADFETTDWTEMTHSKSADPDFDEVFDSTQVKRFDFVITAERWQSMLDNMTDLYGEFGQIQVGPGNIGVLPTDMPELDGEFEQMPPELDDIVEAPTDPAVIGDELDQNLLDPTLISVDEDPMFVPAEVYYNNRQWYRVGLRFKGNSSLQSSWEQGILKLSFKMDFDEFEDDYPQIDNQRFYGFKKLSLKNNYGDQSLLREKVATDVFKSAGIAVSNTAFYSLYIDHGNGPEYFGLYTLVEEISDTVIDTQFTNDEGNLYKPEDGGANFVEGSFNEENFEKKTNEDDQDWSDIIALFDALHDDTRTSSPAIWRENLEAVFDVDVFLKYLAVNGIIQNWDTYGRMTHNYYLYNNPETSKLTWIPWDNNEALQAGKMEGALALDFSNLDSTSWPLIANLYADDVYKARYNEYLSETINAAFEASSMQESYATYSALVAPYATTEILGYTFLNSPDSFYQSLEQLNQHAENRAEAVDVYLNTQ